MIENHPAVATVRQTSYACPEQYEGTLTDGRTFYLRYRHGVASVAVGGPEAVGQCHQSVAVGGGWDGVFPDDSTRDRVVAELFGLAGVRP